jgi:hypothetical protein
VGFLSSVFGSDPKAQYQQVVNPAEIDKTQYGGAIQQGMADQGQARAQQTALSQMLFDQARGGGPNLADQQLKMATDRSNANTQSLIASQRGLNPALAAKQIADAQAGQQQQMAGQSALVRGQQQLAAQGELGQVLGQQRGQDLGAFGSAGSLQNQQNQAAIANQMGAAQINAGLASGAAQNNAGMVGGLLNSAGAAAAVLSDERVKTDVVRGPREAVPGVPQATFRYKGEPAGTHHEGVIAQDLEKTHPELVGRAPGGMRTVPAKPPFFNFADGGQVPAGDLHAYLDSLSQPAAPMAAGGTVGNPYDPADQTQPWFNQADPVAPASAPAAPSQTGKAVGAGLGAMGKSMQPAPGQDAFSKFMAMRVPGTYANGGSIHAAPEVPWYQRQGQDPWSAAAAGRPAPLAAGGDPAGKVPGQAEVEGDSPRNDKVHALLSPQEIVLPRSVTLAADAPARAASFVASVLKRSGGQKRMAAGGQVPAPQDLSEGGMVDGEQPKPEVKQAPGGTARGRGRDETKRRIKRAEKPRAEEA